MTAIILAAGYGTRLYPLTLNKPKALLEVGGKTILDRLVENIAGIQSCEKIFIVTNEKFHVNFENWKKTHKYLPAGRQALPAGRQVKLEIKVINDETKTNQTRIGAIGDMDLAIEKEKIDDDLLITGSDNLFELELRDFTEFGESKRPYSSIVLVDVKERRLAKKYGICALDENEQVINFEEKPKSPKSTLAATCLYFIPKEKKAKVREYMKTDLPKDAPGNIMRWLAEKDKLFGYVLRKTWYDIGDKTSLRKADEAFSAKEGGSLPGRQAGALGGRRKEKTK